MKFLALNSTDPYKNLAIEEYFFKKSQEDIFILWQNEPSVVIGKNQNVNSELDLEYVKKNNIHIVRRITGGGAVYHDLGNVNYSFISTRGNNGIDFAYFTAPIIEALCALGVCATLTGRNDIEVEGMKVSGNAQCSSGGRTLHHGTLLFDAELDVLSKALHVDEEKIKAKAIKSTRARVTNLKELIPIKTVEAFIDYLSSAVISKYSPEIIDVPSNNYINEIIKRNESEDWIFPKSSYLSEYTVKRKKKYDFGLIEAELLIEGEKIKDIEIYGDFFGTKDISELKEILKGKSFSDLFNFNVSDYIAGMSDEEFLDFLKEGN